MTTLLYPEGKEIRDRSNAEAEHQTPVEPSAQDLVLFALEILSWQSSFH